MDQDLEQLMLLRELTKTTGLLHEAQVLQLKMWPLVLTHATRSEIEFHFETKKIIFNLTEIEGSRPTDWNKRMELLSKYVKNLLGDEYSVYVLVLGKKVFQSTGVKNVRRKERKPVSPKRARKPGKLGKRK